MRAALGVVLVFSCRAKETKVGGRPEGRIEPPNPQVSQDGNRAASAAAGTHL